METISNELRDLGIDSSIEISKMCYSGVLSDQDPISSNSGRRSAIRGISVGSQFRSSLQSLVADLERTQPHYIRCIKPNLNKSPNTLDAAEVVRQLRYSGMMEAIRIRREGYALREDHQSFYNRFSILVGFGEFEGEAGIEQLVKVLSRRLNITGIDWQIGHSKIFLRKELADKLERLSKLRVQAAARTVGKFGRFVAIGRVANLLTTWIRFRLHMLNKYRRNRATNKITATYRCFKQYNAFISMKRAVTKLQALQRRRLAVELTRRMRDPYGDFSFMDLQKLVKSEKSRLEQAVESQNFKEAAEIESKM